jgi:hypothetical protein
MKHLAHAEDFPPSSAHVWGHCSGSVLASKKVRKTESDESKTGTAAHWVASECLESGQSPDSFVDKTCPHSGIVIDREIAAGVDLYVNHIREQHASTNADVKLHVEQRVYMQAVHPNCFGTCDAFFYDAAANVLWLYDFKFGHRYVSAYQNPQLMLYAIGAVVMLGLKKHCKIVFRIVQPRSYHGKGPVDEWVTHSHVLWPFAKQLAEQAKDVLEDPRLRTGEWCRDCDAIAVCPAARKSVYNLMDYCAHEYELDDFRDSDLGAEYRLLEKATKIVESRKNAIADEIIHRIESKDLNNTGYSLENGRARWHWSLPSEQIVALVGALGIDAETRGVKTVSQVRNSLPKAKRDEFDAIKFNVAEKRSGAKKLVHYEDGKAHTVFGRKP